MLKRTIVVLAALSMLVGLLPAVAVAAAGDLISVNVKITGILPVTDDLVAGDVALTIGKKTVDDTDFAVAVGGVTTGTINLNVDGDWDGSGTTTLGERAKSGATGTLTVKSDAGVTYHFAVTLTDESDADGIVGEITPVTVALPTAGELSGSVMSDVAGSTTDLVIGSDAGSTALISGAPVSIYKSGVLWATLTTAHAGSTSGTFVATVGAGSFTVAVDVTGLTDSPAGAGTSTLLLFGIAGADANSATTIDTDVDTGTNPDEGEVMWFSNKATSTDANVIVVSGSEIVTKVNFLYANAANSKNLDTLDHIDVAVGAFTDTAGYWADSWISSLKTASIVNGCTTTLFCPEAALTRAEFAKMVALARNVPLVAVTAAPFPDVPVTYWAVSYISALEDAGIVQGFAGGNYNPEATISRSEATTIVARAAIWGTAVNNGGWISNVTDGSDTGTTCSTADLAAATLSFVDVPTSYWAAKEITWLFLNGVVSGNAGAFSPEANITRAEMAKILDIARLKTGFNCL